MSDRTFGWVQDPGEIAKLRRVVEIFDSNTTTHQDLINTRIPRLVTDPLVKSRLQNAMQVLPLWLSYADLKGQGGNGPRAFDPCNGIVQAALPGQRREWLSDWAAENFVRWAHALGFIRYDQAKDAFAISTLGQKYIDTPCNVDGVNDVLKDALLSYPPAVRVLRLLSANNHLTKFEIGRSLGFVGENGFTTLPQDLLIRELNLEPDPRKRTAMLSDWDGTSDKYARMIAGWLQHVGWVKQVVKHVSVTIADQVFSANIPQAYIITGDGLSALRHAEGRSRHPRTPKNVFFEMLATKSSARKYLRLRRAWILQALNGRSFQTTVQIQTKLKQRGISVNDATITDDILGFENIGLQIERNISGAYRLIDNIQNLTIPSFSTAETLPDDVQRLKDQIRSRLHNVSHEFLVLIDLSFDRTQDRLFETQTMALLLASGYQGTHLGGANRPDGAAYTSALAKNYGLIIDTKAYSKGFSCSADERREMQNYIQENINRPNTHPTSWWMIYPSELQPPDDFRFLFVSSRFVGDYANQFARLSDITNNTRGAGISAANLLLYSEALHSKSLSLADGFQLFASLGEITSQSIAERISASSSST